MRLAYLLNAYPRISTTFIRREIEAIEALGQPVHRFAHRRAEDPLVDPADVAELDRTDYLLDGKARLIARALAEPFVNPRRFLAMLPTWWRLYRAAGGGFARHVGYLLIAIAFRHRARALGITHVHSHFSTNAAAAAMLSRLLGGPAYSFTVHGPDELIDPGREALAEKVAHAALVVAITDYARGRILAEAPGAEARVRVVHCGIDLDHFPLADGPGREGVFVCVGRLCPAKAQVLIPAAVARVRERFPEVVVELVGDGECRAEVEAEIARHGVGGHVRLLGWASSDRVRERIAGASALLLASHAEGLPIVIMEALAMGRPALTTRIAGIPELVDEGCGWVIEPGSVDQLAAAMADALEASAERRRQMGLEGRRRVEERHDVHKSAAQLLALFGYIRAPAQAGAQVRRSW